MENTSFRSLRVVIRLLCRYAVTAKDARSKWEDSRLSVETYLNTAHSNDEEQLNHEEGRQEIHKGRACEAPQVREQAETQRWFWVT